MKTEVIVLTGAPGVGKTDVGRVLSTLFPMDVAVVDTDSLASFDPFHIDERFYELVVSNLEAHLANYRRWGIGTVIVTGVILPGGILSSLTNLMNRSEFDWTIYGLRADADVIENRISRDVKIQDANDRLTWKHLDKLVIDLPGAMVIDTSLLSLKEVAENIFFHFQGRLKQPSTEGAKRRSVSVTVDEAEDLILRVLIGRGAPIESAEIVARELVESELHGVPSHGLLRLGDYVDAIQEGFIDPAATPTISWHSNSVVVDGNRCFGQLAAKVLAEILSRPSDAPIIAAVRNTGHLGRIGNIGRTVSANGRVLIGFVNFQGGGQKVVAPGGSEGRISTNPIVLSFPTSQGEQFVLDMSTSSIAEGKARDATRRGLLLMPGALIDGSWMPDINPDSLYRVPTDTFLSPLGTFLAPHKGFGLAAFCELMAGMVAGAGHSGDPTFVEGNGGLFFSFSPSICGASLASIEQGFEKLERHFACCPVIDGAESIRLPGRRVRSGMDHADFVSLTSETWNEVCGLI
ncbi:MAG: Ldh family oxidoreductase [Acidimicrobiales bacterium]